MDFVFFCKNMETEWRLFLQKKFNKKKEDNGANGSNPNGCDLNGTWR